ncbi:MAG TPA: ribonuclease P protein component [Bryocella sp.]|nr:ribonuclease P protein component [Bryocella sp.]
MSTSTNFRLRKHADYQRVYKAGRKQFGRQMAYFFALRDAEAAPRSETTGAPGECSLLAGVVTGAPGECSLLAGVLTTGPRVGLTVPKALGKAVTRNRIKRRLREAVRAALPLLSANVDVVLHPKRSVLEAEFTLIQREVETIFRSIEARSIEAQSIEARSVRAAAEKPVHQAPSRRANKAAGKPLRAGTSR